jgi:hypothetical protein
MLELKKENDGIKIDYTIGETFRFTIKTPKRFKEGTKIRFDVSPNGGKSIISKEFIPNGNEVTITLTEEDTELLKISRMHYYKVFASSEDITSVIVYGTIKIKWGV